MTQSQESEIYLNKIQYILYLYIYTFKKYF